MSVRKTVRIVLVCDRCRTEFELYESRTAVSEVRRIAREQHGWSFRRTLDYCARCTADQQRSR